MTTQLFGAVKEVRDEALKVFTDKVSELEVGDIVGLGILAGAASAAIDKAIGGTLDAVENHFDEVALVDNAEEADVTVSCYSGLSDSFFENINN